MRLARPLLMVGAMNRTLTLSLVLGLALAACKKKEDAPAGGTAAATGAATATAAPPPPPPAPDAAVAAAYSADAAKKALGELAACSTQYNCAAYTTLVGFGPAAAPDLVAALGDPAVTKDTRRLIAAAIAEIKPPDVGPKLVEIANTADDSMLQGDLYEAAGASGGRATFDALIAEYKKAIASLDDDRDIPLRSGLRAFPAESVAWAKENLPKAKKDHTAYADLITDSAQAADLPAVVEMLGQTKDPMAKNRLAAKAIELGDTAKERFDVFVAGLSSKDVYDRSDTANFLAKVADKVPAEMKAQLVELLQKGKAGDSGGLTSMGYDEALKKLGAS